MLLSAHLDHASGHYLYEYLRSPGGQIALLANTSQTGVPAIARPTSSVKAIRILVPTREVLSVFDNVASSLAALGTHAREETRTLTALRDTLLPKLLSGELRVPDAEKTVSAVL
jgi:type I restriction enzyme S subunit